LWSGSWPFPGLGAHQAHGLAPWEAAEDPLKEAEAEALRHAAASFGVPLIEGTDGDTTPGGAPARRRPLAERRPSVRPRRSQSSLPEAGVPTMEPTIGFATSVRWAR
jgi:hypothetical protein